MAVLVQSPLRNVVVSSTLFNWPNAPVQPHAYPHRLIPEPLTALRAPKRSPRWSFGLVEIGDWHLLGLPVHVVANELHLCAATGAGDYLLVHSFVLFAAVVRLNVEAIRVLRRRQSAATFVAEVAFPTHFARELFELFWRDLDHALDLSSFLVSGPHLRSPLPKKITARLFECFGASVLLVFPKYVFELFGEARERLDRFGQVDQLVHILELLFEGHPLALHPKEPRGFKRVRVHSGLVQLQWALLGREAQGFAQYISECPSVLHTPQGQLEFLVAFHIGHCFALLHGKDQECAPHNRKVCHAGMLLQASPRLHSPLWVTRELLYEGLRVDAVFTVRILGRNHTLRALRFGAPCKDLRTQIASFS